MKTKLKLGNNVPSVSAPCFPAVLPAPFLGLTGIKIHSTNTGLASPRQGLESSFSLDYRVTGKNSQCLSTGNRH